MLFSEAPSTSQQEEKLLPGPPPNFQNLQLRRQSVKIIREKRSGLKGPLRAARLCLLSVFMPGLLVAVPLYMRFHVYGEQMYPVGMSDMRLLDNRVSTTWCQRQLVRANTTFNAFLMPDKPVVEPEPLRVSMERHLELEDDMKEYWAFYLLQGSSVTVSTCVRWPGASLVIIRGHKHLHQCAYIGDDSSEELEEMEANVAEGDYSPPVTVHDPNHIKKYAEDKKSTANGGTTNESNEPNRMRRYRPGIHFHSKKDPISSAEKLPNKDEGEPDDVDNIVLQLLQSIGRVKTKIKAKEAPSGTPKQSDAVKVTTESPRSETLLNNTMNTINSTVEVDSTTAATSSEVFEDVLRRLQKLGDGGKSVLRKLNKQLGEVVPSTNGSSQHVDLNTLRNIIREMLHDGGVEAADNGESEKHERKRRGIILSSPGLKESLNAHDEEQDAALEEGFQPDGIADHHETVNETTLNDKSKSEYWSSFSSSEERLLNCEGLILNLPLTPHSQCERSGSDSDYSTAGHDNSLTYKIPSNGYYFFVFSSENEKQKNYFRVHFDLEKRVYNVSNSMVACTNSTEQCSLPLDFFSSEKVVLELPVRANDSLWNEEFIAVSTCEPRTALYLGCVIAVPLFILLFAFQ
ncbi:hypothetical protein C0J52_13621 [Blattella germanica]|nr:hypothetical protein C0J52_13621 [Blattella germanica]